MNCPECTTHLKNAFRCPCGWRDKVAIPESAFDVEAHKAALIARANAEVPEELRGLTPAEHRSLLRQMGGFARLVNLGE